MPGRLTMRELELFVAVCELGGVSAAARELRVAQPSVSQAVRDLEGRFGVALFDRMPRGMVPTDAGRRLLAHAQEVLGGLEALVRDMEGGGVETIRVAASITTGTRYLPGILRALRRGAASPEPARPGAESARPSPEPARPGVAGTAAGAPAEDGPVARVRARVRVEDSASVERDVVAGTVDVGLVEGIVTSPDVVAEAFARDRLVAVAPPRDAGPAWAPGLPDELTPEVLAGLPLLLRERGSGVRALLEAALRARGLACEPVWESVSTQALVAAVGAGLGVSVLPQALVAAELARGRLRRLEVPGLDLSRDLLVIRHRRRAVTPGLRAFLDVVGAEVAAEKVVAT